MKREHVFILGLTGSIGMGKSTVAGMFSDLGAVIIDSDSIVHGLLDFGGGAVDEVLGLCSNAKIVNDSGLVGVDRNILGDWVLENGVDGLEAVLHPLIAIRRGEILDELESRGGFCLVVLDVPLLFEKNIDKECDFVVVVSAGEEIQKERVMARDGMTEEKFKNILKKQMLDVEKKRKADLVLDSSCSLEETRKEVEGIYNWIKSERIKS